MKRATTPTPVCESGYLKVLKRETVEVPLGNGLHVKRNYWRKSTKKLGEVTKTKFPIYDARTDGNVFTWILSTVENIREIRQKERRRELEKAPEKPKSLDRSKVEN